jgi:hypothetical protein
MKNIKSNVTSVFSIKKNKDSLVIFVQPIIKFNDILLVLISISILILLYNSYNFESSNYFIWIFILILIVYSLYIFLSVLIRYFSIKTSKLFVSFKEKEIIVTKFFSKRRIDFDDILNFQISAIKKYGIYNSSGGVRGPDILTGIIEIESTKLGIFKIFEFDSSIIVGNESILIDNIQKNGQKVIRELGIQKSIIWRGLEIEHSN